MDISFLRDRRDWSYHLQPDFCFLDGGPFLRNLITCLVELRRISAKEVTRSSTLGWGSLRRWSRSKICSCSWVWGSWNLVDSRTSASGDQSKRRKGEGVELGEGGVKVEC